MRLKALTSPTTQTTLSARLAMSLLKADHPKPTAQSSTPRPTSTASRTSGPSIRRSSIVPTTAMSTAPPRIQPAAASTPPSRIATGSAARTTAAPPR